MQTFETRARNHLKRGGETSAICTLVSGALAKRLIGTLTLLAVNRICWPRLGWMQFPRGGFEADSVGHVGPTVIAQSWRTGRCYRMTSDESFHSFPG
jgi:hypothetical protein